MTTFTGFSEEDLQRIKSADSDTNNETSHSQPTLQINTQVKKLQKIGFKAKTTKPHYKLELKTQTSDEVIDNITFEKCRLSMKPNSPSGPDTADQDHENNNLDDIKTTTNDVTFEVNLNDNNEEKTPEFDDKNSPELIRESDTNTTPDIVRGVKDYSGDELEAHKVNLEELQLRQKLMEEQNKKRKEMLARALADRTKQTEEEVLRLEKIKKELQVLDGQFTMDVSVLRKKIDQACLTYADAEKHYLKVEKEFLQAKINLQKEKEKKELLTEHLCALITHNETRKAQKLETLMYQLVDDKRCDDVVNDKYRASTPDDETPVIVDGVDVRTGKIVDIVHS